MKIRNCQKCGISFLPKTPHSMYCSNCNTRSCLTCNNTFIVRPAFIKRGGGKYCSKKCFGKGQKGKKLTKIQIENLIKRNRLRKTGEYKQCSFCGGKTGYRYPRDNKRNTKHTFCTVLCKAKFAKDPSRPLKLQLRDSSKAQNWRKKVYERDRWQCRKCGQKGGQLNAHHIKLFSLYPELIFDLDNGITLCRKCHIKEHTTHWKNYIYKETTCYA